MSDALDTDDEAVQQGPTLRDNFVRQARKTRQVRYLAQSVRLEEAVAPHVARLSILVISLALCAFIIWASFARVEEIARVEGEITPLGFQQVVQHLEGGIVKSINVLEGDMVEKGDLLLQLDSVETQKDLERTQIHIRILEMRRIRLHADAHNYDPDYSAYLPDHAEEVADNMALFEAAADAEDSERLVLVDQVAQRKSAIEATRTRLGTTLNNLSIVKDLFQKRRKLRDDGIISDVRFLETKQRLNDLEGEVENLKNQIVAAEIALAEFETRLQSLDAKNQDDDLQAVDEVEIEIAETREILAKLIDRSERLDVRAPTRGIVKGLEVNTIGSVVQPGQLLMEIVPLDKQLVAMIRVPPDNIGYVSVDQRVKLKVSTYDFSRFGYAPGRIEHISAATFINESGDSFYNARVVLERNYVGDTPANQVLPGMTVIADVIIGRKTIMQYLLKPIHQSLKTAFTER